jgi:uncharacterized protein (TIGR01777 family)
MHILITGGTGFIGGALVQYLVEREHSVVVYTRSDGHIDGGLIRYLTSLEAVAADERFDAFINLAGESIAGRRWSESRKRELVDSRIGTTRALYDLACRLEDPPALLLSASAIGYYGPQGDERLAENAPTHDCFSHRLCLGWEAEARRFENLGTRVCVLRLGVVLAAEGGAMEELRKSVMFGLATWMGSGRQWLSWIHREDVIRAIEFLLAHKELRGEFNLTAPEPVTNRGFCEEMRAHRFSVLALPIPGFVLRAAMGELAEELLLTGQRVLPRRLQEAGFEFRYNTLAEAMPALLAN